MMVAEDVRLLHSVIDRRIALATSSGPPVDIVTGLVLNVIPDLRIAMVNIGGAPTPSAVTYPALPVELVAGDRVVVQRRPDGWLAVTHVLGRDPDQPTPMFVSVTEKRFGAVGDGVADDTLPIQRAVDFAFAAGGMMVYFPPGTYLCGRLEIKDFVTLQGAGRPMFSEFGGGGSFQSMLKLKAGTDASLLWADLGRIGFVIRDLVIDGNAAENIGTSHGIELRSASPFAQISLGTASLITTTGAHGLLEGQQMRLYQKVGGSSVADGTTYYVLAADLTATTLRIAASVGGAPLAFGTDLTGGYVSNLHAANHSASSAIEGCYVKSAVLDGIHIGVGYIATRVKNTWVMFNGRDGVSVGASDCLIDQCMIGRQPSGYGIRLRSVTAKVDRCDVWGNLVDIGFVADAYGSYGPPSSNTVSQCIIQYAVEDGIVFGAGTSMNTVGLCLFDANSYGLTGAASDPEYQTHAHVRTESTLVNTVTGSTFTEIAASATRPHAAYDFALGASGVLEVAGNVSSGVGVSHATAVADTPANLRTTLASGESYADAAGDLHVAGAATLGGSGSTLHSGSGVPSAGLGADGDVYFRTDTPGTANQRIYVKAAGAWTGVV